MGVSIYVMPLRTWLSGDFRTTWELREEVAGKPGLQLTPEGIADAPDPRESDEDVLPLVEEFRQRLSAFVTAPLDWDEEAEFRSATTMSYGSYGNPRSRAQQWTYRMSLPRLQAMEAPQIWLPVPFEPTIRIAAPWDEEGEVRVVSSAGLASELDRLSRLMDEDPLMEELKASEGGIVSAPVAEFDDQLDSIRQLRRIAESSLRHRLPVIVEG